MAISQIFIDNLDSTNAIALSVIVSRDRQIHRSIPVAGNIEVGSLFTIDELNRNVDLQYLITKSKIRVRPVAGTSDLAGLPGMRDLFGRSSSIVQHVTVAAGAGGAADDVLIYTANSPRLKILDSLFVCTAGNAGGRTVTLRTAIAAGGSAVSDAFACTSTGVQRSATLASIPSLAAGSSLVARRSDSAIAGELLLVLENA